MADFVSQHLGAFSKSVEYGLDPDEPGGRNAKAFGGGIPGVCSDVLPDRQLSRKEVIELVSRQDVSDLTVCAAIMAWGGMRYNHRNMLFSTDTREEWLEVVQKIRNDDIDRESAYDLLKNLRPQKSRKAAALKGAGPAYFTKLIYFLMPRDGARRKAGYILDQWAGCSINVLADREVVLMNVSKSWKQVNDSAAPLYAFTVSDENTAANYEAFCCAVDRLVGHFSVDAGQVDRALVSDGGQNPKAWRAHVMRHRRRLI